MTLSIAVFVAVSRTAEIVTEVVVATVVVVIVKLAEVAPAGTVTLGGTEATPEFEERDMVVPPAGAAPLRFTR